MDYLFKKQVYKPFEIGSFLQISEGEVQDWICAGKLRGIQIPGGHWRVPFSDFKAFLSQKNIPLPSNWMGDFEKFRVLIVEDDEDLLEIFGGLLKDEPLLEVKTESSGLSAVLQIRTWNPDLVLLDFVMPGMDGFDLMKELKSDPQTRDIPILAITALSTQENRQAVLDAGVSAFLGKPFQSAKMLKTVLDLLGISQKGSSSRS